MKIQNKLVKDMLQCLAMLLLVLLICCVFFPDATNYFYGQGRQWLDSLLRPGAVRESVATEQVAVEYLETAEGSRIALRLSAVKIEAERDVQRLLLNQQSAQSGLIYVKDETPWPPFAVEPKYTQYPLSYLYFLVQSSEAVIYRGPSWDSEILRTAELREKLSYVETVGTASSVWYHVRWYEDQEGNVIADGSAADAVSCFGFVLPHTVTSRVFQFGKMADALQKADDYAASGALTYISNYKNYNGEAPLYYGKEQDGGGNPRSQSAPGYLKTTDERNFVYLEDGTLVKHLGYEGDLVKVQVVENDMVYYVPQKYIPYPQSLTQLSQVIVVDVTNQNVGAFEKSGGSWTMVSSGLVTTGTKNQYADPTPPGFYFLIEKKPQFYYYRDGTTIIDGYAPYALRFNGGAYLHGVSTAYQWRDGKANDPGLTEFSPTLGTVPLSHKCVRNYTSHALFLYDWYTPGETLVIVIE